MKVRVHVSLKPGVLDPQGRAVHHSLEGLGFGGVEDVRVGRSIELDVAETTSDADLDEMCRKLLANPQGSRENGAAIDSTGRSA